MRPIHNFLQLLTLHALDPLDLDLDAKAHIELFHVADEADGGDELGFVGDLGAHGDGGGVHRGLKARTVAG